MKFRKQAAILSLAGVMGMSVPVTALAVSPEFARTAQEWSQLQDHVLEYGEIADLIHEYNVTVQNNQYEYNKFIKDYGHTRDDVAKSYRDLADSLESSMSGDDGMGLVSDFQLELQAKQMREQADDNVEDSEIYYLSYAQAEDNLVQSAQAKYITYYKKQLELDNAREQKGLLESQYALAVTQRQAGTGTDIAVLDAEEAILKQEQTIATLERDIEDARQTLIIMLGWKGGDQPEIMALPEIDLAAIEAIDLEADKETALANNYTLKINKKKQVNAVDYDKKDSIQTTINGNERQIGVTVTNSWQSLQNARLSYDQALNNVATEERNMSLTQQKWNAGMITRYEYEQQEITLSQTRISVETSKLSLLEALETYQWNVSGLANAG